MTPNDFLNEYRNLITASINAQNQVNHTLSEALRLLEIERKKHEDFNNSDWLTKHRTVVLLAAPIITLLIVLLGAFTFVATGHTINLKAGNYEIQSQ